MTTYAEAFLELIGASQDLQDAMDEHEKDRFDIGPSKRFRAADARHRKALETSKLLVGAK